MRAAAQNDPKNRAAARQGVPYAAKAEAMQFAQDLAERRNLDPEWTRRAIAQARYLPVVARLMQPAPRGAAKNWASYRRRFIDGTRIAAGVAFWQQNREALQRAEKEFGVPADIIVGIIGVETIYGRQMGDFRVLDALATLAFNFPAEHPRAAERQAYFRGELEQFLSLQHLLGADPAEPLGSYAGAMGMPQFMPSSWVKWAVDFDGDGRVDLRNNAADVIGSVANYFKGYGWQPGMPTHYPVRFDAGTLDKDALLAPDILPTFSVASFAAKGALLQGPALEHQGPLALVELQNGPNPPSYVAGTENFYVITRYNWSSYYAMAVIELGQEVRQALGDAAAAPLSAAPATAAAPVPVAVPVAAPEAPAAADAPAQSLPAAAIPAAALPSEGAETPAPPAPSGDGSSLRNDTQPCCLGDQPAAPSADSMTSVIRP